MESPFFQFVPIVFPTFLGYHWEDTVNLFTLTHQVFMYKEMFPLKAEHPQLTQPLLMSEMLRSLNRPSGRFAGLAEKTRVHVASGALQLGSQSSRGSQLLCGASAGRAALVGVVTEVTVPPARREMGFFAFAAKPVLMRCQGFSCCWTVLAHYQGFLSFPIPTAGRMMRLQLQELICCSY